MSWVTLRLSRNRRTAWEAADAKQLVKVEFRDRDGNPDLRVSVYRFRLPEGDVPWPAVLRSHTEHAASALDAPPPRGGTHLDLEGLVDAPVVQSDAERVRFARTRKAHHEIILPDATALSSFAQRILAGAGKERFHTTTGKNLLDYAVSRVDSQDAEWVEALRTPPTSKWQKAIDRRRGEVPSWVAATDRERLNLADLTGVSPSLAAKLTELGDDLDAHMAAFDLNADCPGVENLSSQYLWKALPDSDVRRIKKLESAFGGRYQVVAFERPLRVDDEAVGN